MSDNYEAEIYTIGTGVWRSIGNAYGGLDCQLPFNAYLRGALHWVSHGSESSDVFELINSFDFEREQFRPLPPPSYFGPREKQFSDCLKLGVLEGCLILCKRKSLRDTKFTKSREFRPIGYNPCFDVAKAEEVKRVQGARKCDKPSAEGSSGCAGSGMPPHKSAKLDSGHDLHTLEEDLPRATNSAVSVTMAVSWRIGTACTLCGGDLGYLFRGKGFPACQQCFDAGST
ncbi:hypothetical protein ACFX15_021472 [Malus domestica]